MNKLNGGYSVRKAICVALVMAVVLSACTAGLAFNIGRSGSLSAPITAAFCRDQPDKYAYWTQNAEQAALLAVLIAEDMAREKYTDYNYCFPVRDLSCVTFNQGSHVDRDIHVIYMCADAYLIAYYDSDSGNVRYWIDEQMPDINDFVYHYVSAVNNGYHKNVYWNMDYTMDFPEGNAAFSNAMKKWNSYLQQHPELVNTDHIGY